MQVNFHKYKSAALWSKLLSRKQEKFWNCYTFTPSVWTYGTRTKYTQFSTLLRLSRPWFLPRVSLESIPRSQRGFSMMPARPRSVSTLTSSSPDCTLQGSGWLSESSDRKQELAYIKPTNANITWQHLWNNQTWTEFTLTSSHRAKAFFACQHSDLYLWIPTAG